MIHRALISVSDKTDLAEFGRELERLGVEIISSGGTFNALNEAGVTAQKVADFTGFPEMIGGRVKTLQPKIHAGILANRESKDQLKEMAAAGMPLIDLVVVNLYPFSDVLKKGGSEQELVENIDIGGVALLRAAAKNFSSVTVIAKPEDYELVLAELKEKKSISEETRRALATKAFKITAEYDSIISSYFAPLSVLPEKASLSLERVQECRYGENPHQKAAVYRDSIPADGSVLDFEQLNGKDLSFNNFLDFNAAVSLVKEFSGPCAVIVKHGNPCGVACNDSLSEAFSRALECDSMSAFGSIIALNRECDLDTAKKITDFFNEAVVAPSFSEEALAELKQKKNLRVLKMEIEKQGKGIDVRRIDGGILLQETDSIEENPKDWKTVTEKKPSEKELSDLEFAWKVVKHVKSNAIVVVKDNATIGIGAGQMNRVQSVKIALENAGEKCNGAVIGSDAFFPFRDSVDLASEKGIAAFITPGGSIKDEEVINAADEKKVSMLFTGIRHFRH